MEKFSFDTIGTIHSCFKEKFGIPRQSGLVPQAEAILKLKDGPFYTELIRGLEGFSHIWVIFVFHGLDLHDSMLKSGKKSLIRPPRLGGQKKVGVLATRSPHRPNPIGLSSVELTSISWDAPGGAELLLRGVDLLDGTPVLDIKPYLPYADSIPQASLGWTAKVIEKEEKTEAIEVVFSQEAEAFLRALGSEEGDKYRTLMTELLKQDPRPAFQRKLEGNQYGMRIHQFDFRWEVRHRQFRVLNIVRVAK